MKECVACGGDGNDPNTSWRCPVCGGSGKATASPDLRALVEKWDAEADHYQERAENGRYADLARGEFIGLASARRRDARELEASLTGTGKFDRSHDQEAPCADCGHTYNRHFDWADGYRPGCKYCDCITFRGTGGQK